VLQQAEALIAEYLRQAAAPPDDRDPAPVLERFAAVLAPLDPRLFCRHLAEALSRRDLPAPPAESLAYHLGQPPPVPERLPEPPAAANPTFAFVLSNYNQGKWLQRSVPALCEQSRPADQVLVIDDHSSDDSVEILDMLNRKYDTLKCFRNSRNTGYPQAIRNIWPEVTSDYVIFAAADDLVSTDFLATVEPCVRAHPTVGAVHGMTYVWFQQSGRTVIDYPAHLYWNLLGHHSGAEFRRLLLSGPMTISGNVACFRRSVIDALGMFDPGLEHAADTFLFQQVLLEAGVCYLETPLGIFSRHGAQHSTVNVRDSASRIGVNNRIIDHWVSSGRAAFRSDILRYPAQLENYPRMVGDMAWRTDAWDILIAYISWVQRGAARAATAAQYLQGR